MNRKISPWEAIHGFSSQSEYERFVSFIEKKVKYGTAEEIPYQAYCGIVKTDGEYWFKEYETGEI